ncbi:MAG: hypothetical protein HYY16_02210 [Planctomycetes bacterium]|nr:hypothetical protein [Planctomycetota bacterium]
MVLSLMWTAVLLGAQDEPAVDNPEYRSWSDFPAGACVTLRQTIDDGERRVEMETTHTLVKVTRERVFVESRTVSLAPEGKGRVLAVGRREIPAKLRVKKPSLDGREPLPEKPADGQEWVMQVREGEEKLRVGEREVMCRFIERTIDCGDAKRVAQVWFSREVPGGLVKLVAGTEGPVRFHVRLEVVSFKKGKEAVSPPSFAPLPYRP